MAVRRRRIRGVLEQGFADGRQIVVLGRKTRRETQTAVLGTRSVLLALDAFQTSGQISAAAPVHRPVIGADDTRRLKLQRFRTVPSGQFHHNLTRHFPLIRQLSSGELFPLDVDYYFSFYLTRGNSASRRTSTCGVIVPGSGVTSG